LGVFVAALSARQDYMPYFHSKSWLAKQWAVWRHENAGLTSELEMIQLKETKASKAGMCVARNHQWFSQQTSPMYKNL